MTLGAKVLAAAAVLCLLIWMAILVLGVHPFTVEPSLQVIYGEGEDFYADAAAYRMLRSDSRIMFSLPHARVAYRWWSVDLDNMTIALIRAPRAAGRWKYLLKSDPQGTMIGDSAALGEWSWNFTDSGVAFSGNGFTCSMRRMRAP